MEDLDLDPLTWEHDLPTMADPDTRVEYAIAEASYAMRMINQNSANAVIAIHTVLEEARDTPSVFVGPHASRHNRDHVEFAVRAAVSDLAVQLSISENTVLNYDRQAVVMRSRTPKTWSAFRHGEITPQNAKVVTELADSLPDDPKVWVQFDDKVADLAIRLTPPRFRTRARVIREKLLGATLEERTIAEAAFRKVISEPHPDGMASIYYYGPADKATMIMARIEEEARALSRVPGETRTMDQLRADVLADIMLTINDDAQGDGTGRRSAVGVQVGLLVPVMSLLGHDDQPATLEGYGPIDIATAAKLTAMAKSFYRILTHPITGTILDIDRTTLRIPADMRRWLEIRDQTCVFPGCGKRARHCQLDHTKDRQYGGITKVTNLANMCEKHHHEKHHTLWTPEHLPDGRIRWTSPTGFVVDGDPPPF
ncbi:MAG: DUF222 domain-containing protein [Rhodoglobus sp.]